MDCIVEVLLDNVRQRLFLWDVSHLTIFTGQRIVLAKKKSVDSFNILERRCFVPIFADSSTAIDSNFISSMHEIRQSVQRCTSNSTEKGTDDLALFIAFVDSSGTIAYYKCECLS